MSLRGIIPVTALACIENDFHKILLVGRGQNLSLYDSTDHTIIGEVLLKHLASIHGIIHVSDCAYDDHVRFTIFVYGGAEIAILSVFLPHTSRLIVPKLHVEVYTSLPDRILTGKTGSADLGTLLTSYNSLVEVSFSIESRQVITNVLNTDLCTFLYSGDFVQVEDGTYIICSGTAFGQILTWTLSRSRFAGTWQAQPWREYQGHNGSIFGISISPQFEMQGKRHRVCASCSDDRTIRIWDLSDIDSGISQQPDTDIREDLRPYTKCDNVLATTWAHLSRIWHVDFCHSLLKERERLLLYSAGEDGQTQAWWLDITKSFQADKTFEAAFSSIRLDRAHVGKNIWARCHSSRGHCLEYYSGGADGLVIQRSLELVPDQSLQLRPYSIDFKSLQTEMRHNSMVENAIHTRAGALKTYVLLDANELLATTDAGCIVHAACQSAHYIWTSIMRHPKGMPYILATRRTTSHAFFADPVTKGLFVIGLKGFKITAVCTLGTAKLANVHLVWYGANDKAEHETILIAASFHGTDNVQLCWLNCGTDDVSQLSTFSVQLPENFEFCSAAYESRSSMLLCGSRAGAIVAYSNIGLEAATSMYNACRRRVHNEDTVTSILALPCSGNAERCEQISHFVTTGRDGTYTVLRIIKGEAEIAIEVVHRVTLPFGPNVEGVAITPGLAQSTNLIFYGFRSKHFVLWNESLQTELMTLDCGGAHRSWAFWQNGSSGFPTAFIWTQAGTFHHHIQDHPQYQVLQTGGHGREIKAVAIHHLELHRWLVATGSEDTDIRLFLCDMHESETYRFRCVSVLRKHTTGIQCLRFSDDGRYLFSAAGMEELFAWHICPVPLVMQGVIFAAALPPASDISDARIMSFDVKRAEGDTQCNHFTIAAAFSNGSMKLISYHPAGETDTFSVVAAIEHGHVCLTQACYLPTFQTQEQRFVLFASTKGNVIEQRFPLPGSGKNTDPTSTISQHFKVHQNSVTTMQTISLYANHKLCVTGGDDGALGFTILCYSGACNHPSSSSRTVIVPEAHAAAVSTLLVVELYSNVSNESHLVVITAGNDQYLRTWLVKTALSDLVLDTRDITFADAIRVQPVQEYFTNVADISDMVAMSSGITIGSMNVLVVGIGMEVIEVKVPCHETLGT